MKKIRDLYGKKVTIIHEYDRLQILFDFTYITSREVYIILGEVCQKVNTRGILNKLTVELAKITNLAEKDGNYNDFQTRGESIYRGISRYKKSKATDGFIITTTQQGYLPAKSNAGAGCRANQNWQ